MNYLHFSFKHFAILSVSLAAALTLFCALAIVTARVTMPADLPPVGAEPTFAIDNVSVVDVENGRILSQQQILIQDGKISAIRPAGDSVTNDTHLVDAQGSFASPGLTDMHTHIHDRKDLVTSLAHGVTMVRNLRGLPMHLRWRDELDNGQWLGATMITASPVLDRPEHSHLMQQAVTSPAHAQHLVRTFAEEGYDLVKVYNDLSAEILEAIFDEANKTGIAIAKHGPYGALPERGRPFKLKQVNAVQSYEHVEEIFQTVLGFNFDPVKLDEFIEQLKLTEAFVTPTLATYDHLTQLSVHKQTYIDQQPVHKINPFFGYLNRKFAVERWLQASQEQADWNLSQRSVLLQITKRLADNDIPLLVGSDQGTMVMTAGISTHREMMLMQEAGIEPASIVASATLNAAKAMGMADTHGSISVGKVADLLLTEHNPLQDVRHLNQPIAVVKAGQWLDQPALNSLIASGDHPSHWYPSFGRFLEDVLSRAFL